MKTHPPELDILVIAHNNIELTIRCVKAIYNFTFTPFHLIIVDDSTDLTPDYFTKFSQEHDNCTYLHSDTRYMSSYPVIKEALAHCKTPYMALVVNSIIVEPYWEPAGLKLMRENPKVAVVALKCLYYQTEIIESAGLYATVDARMLEDIGKGQASHRFSYPTAYDCVAVQWAFVLLRKRAIEDKLDTQLYHGWKGWEEFETCYQLRADGWKIIFCGLGVGYHQARSTRGISSPEDNILNLQNREIFAKRWGFWENYHKYAAYVGEFFPDMPLGHSIESSPITSTGFCGINPSADSFTSESIAEIAKKEKVDAASRC